MPSFAIRRKSDKQFLGVVNCNLGLLFDKIDETVDPYSVEFSSSKLSHHIMVWEEFTFEGCNGILSTKFSNEECGNILTTILTKAMIPKIKHKEK